MAFAHIQRCLFHRLNTLSNDVVGRRRSIFFVIALLSSFVVGAIADSAYLYVSSWESFDPETGFVVCRNILEHGYTTVGIFDQKVSQCMGRCPNGNYSEQSHWRNKHKEFNRRLLPLSPGVKQEPFTVSYSCSANVTEHGTCIRSPSNGCHWLVVGELYQIFNYNYVDSNSPSVQEVSLSCKGPRSGECTWYEDPYCTQILPSSLPPNKTGGVTCPRNQSSWDPKSWCADAYNYLFHQNKTTCPDVKQVVAPVWCVFAGIAPIVLFERQLTNCFCSCAHCSYPARRFS